MHTLKYLHTQNIQLNGFGGVFSSKWIEPQSCASVIRWHIEIFIVDFMRFNWFCKSFQKFHGFVMVFGEKRSNQQVNRVIFAMDVAKSQLKKIISMKIKWIIRPNEIPTNL